MTNFRESGDRFCVVLDANVQSGTLVFQGELVGVAISGGLAGERVTCRRQGVFSLPKVVGAISQGDKLYKKADENAVTKIDTDNTFIGVAHDSAAASDAEVDVLLKG